MHFTLFSIVAILDLEIDTNKLDESDVALLDKSMDESMDRSIDESLDVSMDESIEESEAVEESSNAT